MRDFSAVFHSWFVTDLKLIGNDLLVFIILYSYSQSGQGSYWGSLEYLQTVTGASRTTVYRSLLTLQEAGIISKGTVIRDKRDRPEYFVNMGEISIIRMKAESERSDEKKDKIQMVFGVISDNRVFQNETSEGFKMKHRVFQNETQIIKEIVKSNISLKGSLKKFEDDPSLDYRIQEMKKNISLGPDRWDFYFSQWILSREEKDPGFETVDQVILNLKRFLNSCIQNDDRERKNRPLARPGKPAGDKLSEWYPE
jgi:hypothetical protein